MVGTEEESKAEGGEKEEDRGESFKKEESRQQQDCKGKEVSNSSLLMD